MFICPLKLYNWNYFIIIRCVTCLLTGTYMKPGGHKCDSTVKGDMYSLRHLHFLKTKWRAYITLLKLIVSHILRIAHYLCPWLMDSSLSSVVFAVMFLFLRSFASYKTILFCLKWLHWKWFGSRQMLYLKTYYIVLFYLLISKAVTNPEIS